MTDNIFELSDDELEFVLGGFDINSVCINPETGLPFTGWRNDLPGWEGKWFYFNNGVIVPNSNTPFDSQKNFFVEQSNGWLTSSSDGSEQDGMYTVKPGWNG